jgi:hypothetical protein
MMIAASLFDSRSASSALGKRAGQDGHDVVALDDRHARLRPAARHRRDAGDHLGRIALGKPHMQMHVGAVEERIALAQHRDRASRLQMRGHRLGRFGIEAADLVAVVFMVARDLGGDGVEQGKFHHAGRRCASTMRRALLELPRLAKCATTSAASSAFTALTVSSSGSPGPVPTPMSLPWPLKVPPSRWR